jgi:hypothetical protein
MSLKTVATKVTQKVSSQVLSVQKNSPVLLFGLGAVGITTTVVLACRATLKMGDILEEGQEKLSRVGEVDAGEEPLSEKQISKAKFKIKLHVAIDVAKEYAPSAIIGFVSLGALTGAHVILSRRNASLTAAYAIVDRSFKEYRGRVKAELGAEKDTEFRFGTAEREVAEEGPNGVEVRTLRGYDQKAEKANEEFTYSRIFDDSHKDWSEIPMQNQYRITMALHHARDLLELNGVVFLNDVYDMLGFPRTKAGQIVGWVRGVRHDDNGNPITDGYIDFGIWEKGIHQGKEWVNGNPKAFRLDFNVDGNVYDFLEKA